MSVFVDMAKVDDAAGIIDFMNVVGGETDNLSFGAGEFFQQAAEGEAAFLEHQRASGGFTLVAREFVKGGPRIIGFISADRAMPPRMVHRAQLAMAVSKSHWGNGIGRDLLRTALLRLGDDQSVEVAYLLVRCDNERAIRLYEQFGFENTGVDRGLMKIGGKLVDAYLMSHTFKRGEAYDGKPLVFLREVLDAIEEGSEDWVPLLNVRTGETAADFAGGADEFEALTGEELPDYDSPDWAVLPYGHELDDWGTMRDFAQLQEGAVREKLLDALHRRRAYRRFKDLAADFGLLSSYFAFQSQRHRDIAIEWLDAHDLPWTEGRRQG